MNGYYILLALGLYVAYKLVFDIIVPIYKASRQVHRQFRGMNERMQQQANPSQDGFSGQPNSPKQPRPSKPAPGDYIDFEEIK
jgi:hypothetical protein